MDGDNSTCSQEEHSETSANVSSSNPNVANEGLEEEVQSVHQDDSERTDFDVAVGVSNFPHAHDERQERAGGSEPENISDSNASHEQNIEEESNNNNPENVQQATHFFRLDHHPSHVRRRNGSAPSVSQEEIPSDVEGSGISDATTAVVSDSEGWQTYRSTQMLAPKESSFASSKTGTSSTPSTSTSASGEIGGTMTLSTLSSFTSSSISSGSADGKKVSIIHSQETQQYSCIEETQNLLPTLVLESPDESDHEETLVLESADKLLASTPTGEGNESPVSERMLVMENLDDDTEDIVIPQSPDVFKFPPKILPSTPTEDVELEQESQVLITAEDDKTLRTESEVDDSVKEATKSCVSDLFEPSLVKSPISSRSELCNPTRLTVEQLAKGVELSPIKITPAFTSHVAPSVTTFRKELNFENDSQDSTPHEPSSSLEITDGSCTKRSPHSKSEITSESLNLSSKLFEKLMSLNTPIHVSHSSTSSNHETLNESSSLHSVQNKTVEENKAIESKSNLFIVSDVLKDDPSLDTSKVSDESISLLEDSPDKETALQKYDEKEETVENARTIGSDVASESVKLYLSDSLPVKLSEEDIPATTLDKTFHSKSETSLNQSCAAIGDEVNYACVTTLKDTEENVALVLDAPEAPFSQASETMTLSQELTWTSEKDTTVSEGSSQRDPFAMLRQPDLSFREMMLGLPGPSGLSRTYSHDSDTDSDSLEVKKFQKPKMSVKELLKSHDMMMRLTEQNLDKSIRGKGIGKKSKPHIDKDKLKVVESSKSPKTVSSKDKSQTLVSESFSEISVSCNDNKHNQQTMQEIEDIPFKSATEILETIPASPTEIISNDEKSNFASPVLSEKIEQNSTTLLDSRVMQASVNICDKTVLQSTPVQMNSAANLDQNLQLSKTRDLKKKANESSPKFNKNKKQPKGKHKVSTKDENYFKTVSRKRSLTEHVPEKQDQQKRRVKFKKKKLAQPKDSETLDNVQEERLQKRKTAKVMASEPLLEPQVEADENSKTVANENISGPQSQILFSKTKLLKLSQHRRTSTPKNYLAKKLLKQSSQTLRKSSSSFHLSSIAQKSTKFKTKKLGKQHRIITTIFTKRIVVKETIIDGFVVKREEKQYQDEPVTTEEIIDVDTKKIHSSRTSKHRNEGSSASFSSFSSTNKSSSGSFADISSSVSGNTPILTSSSCTTSTSGDSGKQPFYFPFLSQWKVTTSGVHKIHKKQSNEGFANPCRKRPRIREENTEVRRMKKFKTVDIPTFAQNRTEDNFQQIPSSSGVTLQTVPLVKAHSPQINVTGDGHENLSTEKQIDDKSDSAKLTERCISPDIIEFDEEKSDENTKLSSSMDSFKLATTTLEYNTTVTAESDPNLSKVIIPGSRVFAKWIDSYYYSGKAVQKDRLGRWLVSFDDNSERPINDCDIYRVNFLPVGSSVYAKLEDGCFETGIITDLEINNGNNYTIELDKGGSKKVPISSIMMTADQLACLFGEDQPKKSPPSGTISLKNIVEGKRYKKQHNESFSTQSGSCCSENSPQEKRKKLTTSKRLSLTDCIRKASSSAADSKLLNLEDLKKKSINPVQRKKKLIPKQSPGKLSLAASRKIGNKDVTLKEGKLKKDNGSDLSPPTLASNNTLFKGKGFWLSKESEQKYFKDKDDTEDSSQSMGSFEEMASHSPYSEEHLTKQIISGGGTILKDEESQLEHQELYLISNTHTTSRLYLRCLAQGIPCVSHQWIIDSCKQTKLLNYKSYLLPTGISVLTHDLIEWHNNTNIFEGTTVMLTSSQNKNCSSMWPFIFQIAGAVIVSRLATCSSSFPGVVVCDTSCPPSILRKSKKFGIPIVSTEWAVQCLIHGKILPFNAHADFSNYSVNK